jgi:hypothetical protein
MTPVARTFHGQSVLGVLVSSNNARTALIGFGKNLRLTKTLTSAVTTAWGADWDEIYIARDVMQNFFDSDRNCLNEVRVVAEGKDVRITAAAAFNLDRLFYLGSEKSDDDMGQYGEGFKVAATCLLRDHSVDIYRRLRARRAATANG